MFLPQSVDRRGALRALDSDSTRSAVAGTRQLRLLPSGDGWALVTADGRVAFWALGLSGRRRCLEFAREQGVITLSR